MSNNVIIFDTTLRDGEQALQASLSVKREVTNCLCLRTFRCRYIIEAGFPVSSLGILNLYKPSLEKLKIVAFVR